MSTSKVTKAQLQAEVERLRTHCDVIETKLASYQMHNAGRAALTPPAPVVRAINHVIRTTRELPPHFVAAREAAMRLGVVVRVSA